MTEAELALHRVSPEEFWGRGYEVDGYDRQTLAAENGWTAIASWGSRGWDLGHWPLVTIYMKEDKGRFFLAENVEGDTSIYVFDSEEDRSAACDSIAFFYWKGAAEPWVSDIDSAQDLPDYLRGPYRP
jgi:hypothetical protein